MRRAVLATCLAVCALSGHAAAHTPRIPLVEGTVYTAAAAFPAGDEEHIATLAALDEETATFVVSLSTRNKSALSGTWIRTVRRKDLVDGHRINLIFQTGDPDSLPGSTFAHLSAAALDELKRTGETALVLGTAKGYQGMSATSMFAAVTSGRKYFRGTLKRVGTGPVQIAVVVNGQRQLLPAIATAGRFVVGPDAIDAQFWWLDEPDNALMLRRVSDNSSTQVVRIDWPQATPQELQLAKALESGDCHAALNGIYFDTASASLLPQSKPALVAVSTLMRDHPAWTIAIEGHTDSVGTAAYNLDLSRRRAAAVRDALSSSFHIPAPRLSASGFGAARPIASNSTLDGRAANRRVELARSCP